MKPARLTYLEEGKAVGAHRGFAATFNWLVRFCSNIRGGLGVIVDTTDSDHPVVRMDGVAAVLKPFEVRWNADEGCWSVYVPANAVEGGASFVVHNERIDGDWYKVANQPSGAGVFDVIVHVKRRVKVGNGGVGVAVHVSATAGGPSAPGAEPANRSAGDVFTVVAARCTVSGSGSTVSRKAVRISRGCVSLASEPSGVLELYWACPAVGSSGWQTFTPHVSAASDAPICGGALADTALPASGSATAYYLVDCTGSTPAASVVTSPGLVTGKVNIPVYHLSNGCVVDDIRASLAQAVFYP